MKENIYTGKYPRQYNACVGNNGWSSLERHAEGFISSSIRLCEIAEKELGLLDIFIYPICFNFRHGIELYLKSYIYNLLPCHHDYVKKFNLKNNDKITEGKKKYKNTHKLSDLIDIIFLLLKEVNYSCDAKIAGDLHEIINFVNKYDINGEAFRYPWDKGEEVNLSNVSIINIVDLKNIIDDFYKKLEEAFYYFSEVYLYTIDKEVLANYSYDYIVEICRNIKEAYGKNNDKRYIRGEIKKITKASNNTCDKIYNLIMRNREYSYILGREIKLDWINKSSLIQISNVKDYNDIISLPNDLVAAFISMIEYGRGCQSYNFDAYKELYLERNNMDELHSLMLHYLRKSNIKIYIVKSLEKLKMMTLCSDLGNINFNCLD